MRKGYGLDGFEADFAFLLGAWFADPDHVAADGLEFILTGDHLHDLAAPEPETSPKAESLRGAVHNQAGDPLRLGAEVDHNAGAFFSDDTLGTAGFVCRGHGFALDDIFPHICECTVNKVGGASGKYLPVREE